MSPRPSPPPYLGRVLSNLLPAVGAHLGVAGYDDDPVGLADARRYVVFLVDGLGWSLLRRSIAEAPVLADWLGEAVVWSAPLPSTTVVSLSSLGTGLAPADHGLVGFHFYDRDLGALVAPLSWDTPAVPDQFQPLPTAFERLTAAGVATSLVVPRDQVDSGFTRAVLRGATRIGVEEHDTAERLARVTTAAHQGDQSLVYTYDRSLDHIGHVHGTASDRWLDALNWLDNFIGLLRETLHDDVVLLVTADHGMVDIPKGRPNRISIDEEPDLRADLDHVGGEARFRHLYTGRPAAVVARWRDHLGERAWVLTRDEALAQGWFGPLGNSPSPQALARLGDVIVAVADDSALLSKVTPFEAKLVGLHGSLTAEELEIPLLTLAN